MPTFGLEKVEITQPCHHAKAVKVHEVQRPPKPRQCPDCMKMHPHGTWVHLRECLICGHIGCCENSPNKHAHKHYQDTNHKIITSVEQGEAWVWCYADEQYI